MSNDRSERLTERVLESLAPNDPRLHELIAAAIRHLHSFVREVGLTHHEWEKGIEFLTATGKISTSERQEMILLSDVLGVSSQTELTSGDASATANTVLGPFYVEGSKWREYGDSIVESPDAGARLRVDGVVRRPDGTPVADAVVDVWQNATNALYAVQDAQQDPQNLRGRFRTDDAGRFSFITVRPVAYAIPDDGPVGSLLEHLGRHPMRPAHIHIKVSAPDHQTLVTHLFDSESPYLDSDTVFSVDESLVITVKPTEQGDPPLQVQFDLILAPSAG